MFQRALDFREENSRKIDSRDEFYEFFTSSNKNDHEIHGGFAWVHWDRDPKWEEEIKNDLKVVVVYQGTQMGTCIFSGNPSPGRVVMAKSY